MGNEARRSSARWVQLARGGGGGGGGSTTARMIIKEVKEDYLVCRLWDGESEGESDFYVAKPRNLRKSPFQGKVVHGFAYSYLGLSALTRISRDASDQTDLSTQTVVPTYSGEIYAEKGISGGTGVATVDQGPLVWLDKNTDARQWAYVQGS